MVDGREITLVAATDYAVSTPRYFMGHNLFIKYRIEKIDNQYLSVRAKDAHILPTRLALKVTARSRVLEFILRNVHVDRHTPYGMPFWRRHHVKLRSS